MRDNAGVALSWETVRRRIERLDLPHAEYVAFGSVPMLARRLIDGVSDIDILARGEAWQRVELLAAPVTAPHGDRVIRLPGDIEVFDGWRDFNSDEIIERGTEIDGIRVADLHDVLAFKQRLDREKDRPHVALIQRWLARE